MAEQADNLWQLYREIEAKLQRREEEIERLKAHYENHQALIEDYSRMWRNQCSTITRLRSLGPRLRIHAGRPAMITEIADELEKTAAEARGLTRPEPTWRDVFRAMRAEEVRLRSFGDTSDAVDHRVWQLIDRHDNELGHISHETGYWGEEWTVAFKDECGPATTVMAAALEPTVVLALARISGLIGGTS